MIIIPAIDILNGQCVRLTQGDYTLKKVYADDPVDVALAFQEQGAEMLHLVDLDGAKTGEPKNREILLRIREELHIPLEVGGGIRDIETVAQYVKAGINRIILGTKAVEDLAFLKTCLEKFGAPKIVVGLDVRYKKVATRGWGKTTGKTYLDYAKELQALGVTTLIYTDIMRDGTLTTPNFKGVEALRRLNFQVIASGGISDRESIEKLRTLKIDGAILGKALYEGTISLPEAMAAAQPPSNLTKRLIPCLDVKDGRVVKGVHFQNLRDAGDPVELGKRYSEEGADELVFLDISASQENRKTLIQLVSQVAQHVFIPFTVGGGIRSVDEIREALHHGADKVSLNTAAVENPSLISEASQNFGAQCVVVAIDVKKAGDSYKVFIRGGTQETPLEAVAWAKQVESLGAGEILLTSMDRDGTKQGFDLEILRKISEAVNIPVIASGGAGSLEDLKRAVVIGKADAVLAASLFHDDEITLQKAKEYLAENRVPVRL